MSSKTPSVLFYAGDYLVGVIGMTWEEQGRYMYLLCLQQQKGHLHLETIMPDCPKIVLEKFERDEEGLYFNRRMEEEMERRYKFVESRRKNAKGKAVDKAVDNFSQPVDKSAYAERVQRICSRYAEDMQVHMDNDNDNDKRQ